MPLINTARAVDSQEFVWRVSVESRKLSDWVLDNPLVPIPRMTALVAANGTVSASVVVQDGAVDTSQVDDYDITYVVDVKWETVARQLFPTTPTV
ncbi:hypothetical protein SEA_EMOTION_20 [Arthrobacter phage Emotion]|uniref:Uncharacterized protein n=1 Tax=Arthrobacter phage Emotion TaxID=3038361 RepID=A0AA49IEM2_9CAUD|nr:hypothetical protein SEA_EMOTION_20 [Arthrobacter phage Emotion]